MRHLKRIQIDFCEEKLDRFLPGVNISSHAWKPPFHLPHAPTKPCGEQAFAPRCHSSIQERIQFGFGAPVGSSGQFLHSPVFSSSGAAAPKLGATGTVIAQRWRQCVVYLAAGQFEVLSLKNAYIRRTHGGGEPSAFLGAICGQDKFRDTFSGRSGCAPSTLFNHTFRSPAERNDPSERNVSESRGLKG